MYFIGNALSDVGRIKKVNQDSLLLKAFEIDNDPMCLAVVCDGVGGLYKGELASATVIRGFEQWFEQFISDENIRIDNIFEEWEQLVTSLNQEICEYGIEIDKRMGTTVVAALFYIDKVYVANVGDSRLYKIKDRKVSQITVDQTVVQYQLSQGMITEEQAANDPMSSVLLQSVGSDEHIQVDFYSESIQKNDRYLLCSDGFRHFLSEEEMGVWLSHERNKNGSDIRDNLAALIDLNKKRGEKDNISAILVGVE